MAKAATPKKTTKTATKTKTTTAKKTTKKTAASKTAASKKAKGEKLAQTSTKKVAAKGGDHLILTLKDGDVVIKLLPELAPNHVERIKLLAGEGFYDGVPFHRVIDGFMAQTGDPTGTGMGKSSYPDLKAEFSNQRHVRGTASMARSQMPDSANSQFFICFDDAPWLDGQYTVWGQVVSGMEHIDALPRGAPGSGTVSNPDKIIKAKIGKAK